MNAPNLSLVSIPIDNFYQTSYWLGNIMAIQDCLANGTIWQKIVEFHATYGPTISFSVLGVRLLVTSDPALTADITRLVPATKLRPFCVLYTHVSGCTSWRNFCRLTQSLTQIFKRPSVSFVVV
jgi:hypothetical protein